MQRATEQVIAVGDSNSRLINLIAGKLSVKYLALGIDWGLAIFMVPFNLDHLGKSVYGLWMLVASIPAYFSLLDLGYSAAIVRFAAQYRAHGDNQALNEIASTIFFFFAGIGLAAYTVAVLLAFNIRDLLNLTPEQAVTGRQVLLIISIYIAVGFPCSVFGGIVKGSMDPYMTSLISIATSLTVVIVNVAVLLAGYGIVTLVAAITAIRLLSYFAYWKNACRVFPPLQIRLSAFRSSRLRELTGFSIALLLIDLANKLNYSTDALIIGTYMSTASVASWAIAQRPAELMQRFSGELNITVFPVVVSSAALGQVDRLRAVFLRGTQLSLAIVIILTICLILLARPLIIFWVGPEFSESIPVIYVLAFVVIIRICFSPAQVLLEGAGKHRLLAISTVATGIANLLLSIFLVRGYGLIGVAFGTLIPLSVMSSLVIFPAACRRIGLSVGRAFSVAILPALWPSLPMVLLVLFTRSIFANGVPALAVQAIIAVLSYCLIFFGLALGREERGWYLRNVKQLIRRPHASGAL